MRDPWRTLLLRTAITVTIAACAGACLDVREFAGTWSGPRVGDEPVLKVGFADDASATLVIDRVDLSSLSARLTTSDGVFDDAVIEPIPGVEADVLADLELAGSPARVFLAFASPTDGSPDALAVVALHDQDRVELRLLRGAQAPLYGIFALTQD